MLHCPNLFKDPLERPPDGFEFPEKRLEVHSLVDSYSCEY